MGQAVGVIFVVGYFATGTLNILSSSRFHKCWGDVDICYGETNV